MAYMLKRGGPESYACMHAWSVLFNLLVLRQLPVSQRQRGLSHELYSPDQTLFPWFRIPFEACMCVCVYSVRVVLCVGSGLVEDWSPVQGVLPTVYRILLSQSISLLQLAARTEEKQANGSGNCRGRLFYPRPQSAISWPWTATATCSTQWPQTAVSWPWTFSASCYPVFSRVSWPWTFSASCYPVFSHIFMNVER
jgi:hypothetical protein